jgi:hypothetical protein
VRIYHHSCRLFSQGARILTEDHQWLSSNPKDLESTPYGRLAQIQYTISSYTHFDGTATHFDISRDGQTASYSTDGLIWRNINYQMWSTLILNTMSMIKEAVANQMPSSMAVSDVKAQLLSDDLSKVAPHKQERNKAHMELTTNMFLQKMASSSENRHHLFNTDDTLDDEMLKKYITQDQEIKGLLCTLLTSCSAVPMRSWQFGSIVFDSCNEAGRNMWIIDGRFVVGKPAAKQLNLVFADTVSWLPHDITLHLVAFLYYQQPFISSLLERKDIHDLLYASHVWALPLTKSRKAYSKVWNGQDINKKVRDLTQQLIGSPVGPPLARQSSQGLLRDKIPILFEIFQSRDNLYLEEGSYKHQECLEEYAIHYGLKGLAHAANMPVNRVSACLIICDIWLSMHRIKQVDPTWQPMVVGSYLFPTVVHDALAYLGAQNLKMIAVTSCQAIFDLDSLTRGVILLTDIGSLEAEVCTWTPSS